MQEITVFGVTISPWIYAPVVYFVWVIIFLIIKKIVFVNISKIAKKTESKLDDILLDALNFPLVLFAFVSGSFILNWLTPFDEKGELTQWFFIALKLTAVVAIILFLDRLLRNLIRVYGDKIDILKSGSGIAIGITRIVVIGLGLLILADSFGISITPIIASLGIGSLAVALALQPTLENLFAGIQIMIDRPIMKDQFVKLDSGEEGYVHKIGWRSTWIRMLPNNVVVVPNKQLITSKILNYYYPEQELAVLVQVGVHYESDLAHVERVTIEVGEEVLKTVQGGVGTFKPFIRYHTFNDFSIDFTVILRAQEFVDNYLVKHEFIKALHKRFNEEGIVIPYPIRALNYEQEGATQKK